MVIAENNSFIRTRLTHKKSPAYLNTFPSGMCLEVPWPRFSFLLEFPFLSAPNAQPPDVIMEVFLDLFEEAKHEEDFVMHEKWGKEERCSGRRYIHSCIINMGEDSPPSRLSNKAGARPSWTPCP